MRRIFSIILYYLCAVYCTGQAFLSKYDGLTRDALPAFFSDWEAYSDSVRRQYTVTDSVIAPILDIEYAENKDWNYGYDEGEKAKYLVFPDYLTVHRFFFDTDTLKTSEYHSWYDELNNVDEDQHVAYRVTPRIDEGELYLTNGIYMMLAKFLGGLRIETDSLTDQSVVEEADDDVEDESDLEDDDEDDEDDDEEESYPKAFTDIDFDNLRELEKYIQAAYDHWGGYWWFTTFPAILDIYYANDEIYINKKYTFSTGTSYVYKKVDGNFLGNKEAVGYWIQ